MAGTGSNAHGGYRATLAHPDFRRLAAAQTISESGGWAYNVALVAVIIDRTGPDSAQWLAIAAFARFIPSMLFSSYAGVIADRFERRRLMVTIDLLLGVLQVGFIAVALLDLHVIVALVLASTTGLLLTVYDPAVAATIPATVDEDHLASANALRETIHNLTVIVGPAIGAVLLFIGSDVFVFAVNGVTFVISAALVGGMSVRSTPVDVTEGGQAGPLAQLKVGVRAMFSTPLAALLVTYSAVATLMYGTDTVLFAAISEDLGTGSEGYGYLLAGLGVGGVLGAGLVARLARRPRLGLIITVGLAVYCLPTAFLVVVDQPAVAFVLQAIRGAGTLVVDTLAIIALQRSMSQDVLARVFGAFGTLVMGSIVLGAAIVSPLLAAFGLDVTLILMGTVVPGLALLVYPWLRRGDAVAVARLETLKPAIAAIEASSLFEDAPRMAVEGLAAASSEVALTRGQTLMRQGEPADALYLILQGSVVVHTGAVATPSTTLATLSTGDHVGEIGVLEGVPRTATVVASEATKVLRIEADSFVDVLASHAPSPALLEGSRQRYQGARRAASTPQMFEPA